MKNSSAKELESLRDLIRGKDKKRSAQELTTGLELLNSKKLSSEEKEKLKKQLSLSFAECLQSSQENDQLTNSLAKKIAPILKSQIKENRDSIIDALYPIMGALISKYVSEALKELRRDVDKKMSEKLSLKRFLHKKSLSSLQLDSNQDILASSLQTKIQGIFLIKNESGLLIEKKYYNDFENTTDPDMIAGLLTAIKSFAEDCFSKKKTKHLKQIEYDDFVINIELLPNAYFAIASNREFNKAESISLRGNILKFYEQHSKTIRSFNGDLDKIDQNFKESFSFISQSILHKNTEEIDSKGNKALKIILFSFAFLFIFLFAQSKTQKIDALKTQKIVAQEYSQEKIQSKIERQQNFIQINNDKSSQTPLDKEKINKIVNKTTLNVKFD